MPQGQLLHQAQVPSLMVKMYFWLFMASISIDADHAATHRQTASQVEDFNFNDFVNKATAAW